jgi:hypothetical protein
MAQARNWSAIAEAINRGTDQPVGVRQPAPSVTGPPRPRTPQQPRRPGSWRDLANEFQRGSVPPEMPQPLPAEPEGDGLWSGAIPLALRIGGAVGGGILGVPGGPFGIAAGGAAGSALGEIAAQKLEQSRGEREEFSLPQLGVQTALGAIPGIRPARTLLRTMGRTGAQGALIGGGATTAESMLERGELPSGRELAFGTGGGAVLGAGFGGAGYGLGRLRPRQTPAEAPPEVKGRPETPQETVAYFEDLIKGRPVGPDTPAQTVGRFADLRPTPASQAIIGAPVSDAEKLKGLQPMFNKLIQHQPAGMKEDLQYAFEKMIPAITERGRGRLSVATIKALSKQIKDDRVPARGSALNAEQYDHLAEITAGLQDDLKRATEALQHGSPDIAYVKVELAKRNQEYLTALSASATEAGRTLGHVGRLRNILMSGDDRLIEAIASAPGFKGQMHDLKARLAEAGTDPLARYKIMKEFNKPKAMDWVRSVWYANILSSIKTQERNFLGNMFNAATETGVLLPAAMIDAMRAANTQGRTIRLDEFSPQMVGLWGGFKKGLQSWKFTMRHGVSPDNLSRTLRSAEIRSSFDLPRVELPGGLANPLNIPGRLLDAFDTLFRTANRNKELHGMAFTQAKNEGLRGEAFKNRMVELITGTTKEAQTLQAQAEQTAARTVFQEKPGAVTEFLREGQRRFPLFMFFAPFLKTPGNIIRQGLEFSPFGFVMKAAQQGGRAGAQAQARAAAGTIALAPLAWLAATGQISGSGPRNKTERDALRETGWEPNSVRIPGVGGAPAKWVSYTLFQPISVPASIVANAVEAWKEDGEINEKSAGEAAGAAIETVFRSFRSLLDQSYLRGLFDVLEAVNDPERWSESYAARLAQSAIPLSGALRNVQQAVDPSIRRPEGIGQRFMSGFPGQTEQIPQRITRFGEPVTREGGFFRRLVDPLNISTEVEDPVSQELARLGVRLAVPGRTMQIKGEPIDLSQSQQQALEQAKGRAVRVALEQLMSRPGYIQGSDARKRVLVERMISRARLRAAKPLRREVIRQQRAGRVGEGIVP